MEINIGHFKSNKKKAEVSILAGTLKKYKTNKYLVIIFLPVIVYYIIFKYGPMYGTILAFKQYNFADGILGSPWVGLEHFKTMFSGRDFISVFCNTLIISSYKLIFGFPAPIILALLFNELRNGVFKKVSQTISYLPYFFSWVVLGGIIVQVLSPSIGPFGYIFDVLKMKPVNFLADPKWFRGTIVLTSIWKSAGWGSVIYLAAISGISSDLYEAAVIDGASRFKRALHITLPSLLPVVTIMLILDSGSIIYDDFDQIFNLYNAAVYEVGDVISTYTYRQGLVGMDYSYGTAVGLFRNLIALALVLITNAIARKTSEYSLT